jgi:LemA protein
MALILLLVLVVSMIVLAVYFLPRRSDPILDRGNNREFNSLIQMNEDVNGKWWKVETQYQRRSDIVPNLVNSVKEYAKYEQKILAEVIEARSKVSKMSITKEVLDDPQAFQNFAQAQSQLSGALSRLMIAVEKYPDLKANENFKNQMVQLEGTENRISVARIDFNTVVQKYNEQIKEYPETARMHDFNIKQFFHGEYGSEESNKVRF